MNIYETFYNAIERAINEKLTEQKVGNGFEDKKIYAYNSIDGRRTTIELIGGGGFLTSVTVENNSFYTKYKDEIVKSIGDYFINALI